MIPPHARRYDPACPDCRRRWRWGVAAVAVLALMVGVVLVAGAQTAPQPGDWWGPRSKDPCAGVVVGTQDCSLETRVKAVLGITKACDVAELIAASREWKRIMGPTAGAWIPDHPTWPSPVRMTWTFVEYGGTTLQQAEQRWRRAVEACQ